MSTNKPKGGATLDDLLAAHTKVADAEGEALRRQIEAKKAEEQQRREADEQRRQEELQRQAEREKQILEQKLRKSEQRAAGEAQPAPAPVRPHAASAVVPAAAAHAGPRAGSSVLPVAVTVVLMAALSAGAYFLLLSDRSGSRDILQRQGDALFATAERQATDVAAAYAARSQNETQAKKVETLGREIEGLRQDLARLTAEKTAAEERATAAEQHAATAAAAADGGTPDEPTRPAVRRGSGTPRPNGGGITVRKGSLGGGTIIE